MPHTSRNLITSVTTTRSEQILNRLNLANRNEHKKNLFLSSTLRIDCRDSGVQQEFRVSLPIQGSPGTPYDGASSGEIARMM